MEVSYSTQIIENNGKVWDTIRSLKHTEKYVPIITKSHVEGEGLGAKRICDVSIGKQEFQIEETIHSLDEQNQSMVVSIDDGPIQMRGMKTKFEVKSIDEKKALLSISTDVINPDAGVMFQSVFEMIGDGLKKFHEL